MSGENGDWMAGRVTHERRRRLVTVAKAEIRRRIADPDLSLKALAEAVGSSPRQLQRVFSEAAGEGFRDYVLRVRMERARQLVERDDLPAHVVAEHCGYRGRSGLIQAFIRYHGQPPSAFRPPPLDYDEEWRARERQALPAADRDQGSPR